MFHIVVEAIAFCFLWSSGAGREYGIIYVYIHNYYTDSIEKGLVAGHR